MKKYSDKWLRKNGWNNLADYLYWDWVRKMTYLKGKYWKVKKAKKKC